MTAAPQSPPPSSVPLKRPREEDDDGTAHKVQPRAVHTGQAMEKIAALEAENYALKEALHLNESTLRSLNDKLEKAKEIIEASKIQHDTVAKTATEDLTSQVVQLRQAQLVLEELGHRTPNLRRVMVFQKAFRCFTNPPEAASAKREFIKDSCAYPSLLPPFSAVLPWFHRTPTVGRRQLWSSLITSQGVGSRIRQTVDVAMSCHSTARRGRITITISEASSTVAMQRVGVWPRTFDKIAGRRSSSLHQRMKDIDGLALLKEPRPADPPGLNLRRLVSIDDRNDEMAFSVNHKLTRSQAVQWPQSSDTPLEDEKNMGISFGV
ncbi:hypothetical protein DFH06DRAFT_1138396 [Mycena polygramma]|nr:hypothetical protein DFH06DRAFT_1138396 [Mycena polygramma]